MCLARIIVVTVASGFAVWASGPVSAAEPGEGSADSSIRLADDAEARQEAVARCALIADDAERLACYDGLIQPPATPSTFIERHWDLRGRAKLFQPWAHRPNYVLPGRWTDRANEVPFQDATAPGEEPPRVQSVEAKFQVSFKTKILEGLFGGPADLWFGYTQQSHFQVYNNEESRPFRETNFEPEGMVIFPLRRTWGEWTWRMVGIGLVHQSNGRSEPLSRSWDRIYAVAGIERKKLAIHLRPWVRIDSTSSGNDDNPDIVDLVGRLEALVQWQPSAHVLSFRARTNLEPDDHNGSLQLDWFFPLADGIRGQLQVFSGYGESLIDYDHSQTTVGVGLLLFDPF